MVSAKKHVTIRLFIDLRTRVSLEWRTSVHWSGQIVRLVSLFFPFVIHGHTLIKPAIDFSLALFVTPLKKRTSSLGAFEIKTMSVPVRS